MMTALMLAALKPNGFDLGQFASASSLLALLDARSPGERSGGALAQTKNKPHRAETPTERTARNVTPPTPALEEFAKVVIPAEPVPFVVDATPPDTLPFTLPPVGTTSIGGSSSGQVTSFAPQIGGSSVPIRSAVPEPGTWLMMLMGFGMVGTAMSRQRRRSTKAMA
ncbi:PEPxxWA-CTERM sorting domain-containing protein [Sphingomonas humi]